MRTRMYGGVAGASGRPLPLCRFAAEEIAGTFGVAQLGRAHERSYVEARAIDRAERWRRRDKMDGAAETFGLTGDGHANHGADLMAGGVVGRQRGSSEQNHGN